MKMKLFHLGVLLGCLTLAYGFPIDPKDAFIPGGSSELAVAIFGVAFLVAIAVVIAVCACCKERSDGFKPNEEKAPEQEFRNSTASLNHIGFTNALSSELAIFPPPGAGPNSPSHPPTHHKSEALTKPAAFSSAVPDILSWFEDQNGNFPRQQLYYQREMGKGWFGKVVEGEARGNKVVVKILREDATAEEQAYFLHEVKPFRDLRHRNVAKLFGRCLDQQPYLLLFEMHRNGDLKSFLVTNVGSKSAINEQGLGLRMMTDVAEGLNHMIENGFIHTDLAARNCLVTSDLTVKIGDYGTSIDLFKDEYYIIENVAVPIRWCAPETLHCTPTTIETKQVTASANVWSLAVLLWEIAQFGALPYEDLTDDQVIIRVFGSEKYRLPEPDCPYGNYLHNILQLCWRTTDRATLPQVLSMLHYLRSNPMQQSDFDARWNISKPNNIPVVDNHTPIHSPRHTELAQRPQLQAKSEFDSGVDLVEIRTSDENPDSYKNSTPLTVSPQLSVTSEDIFQTPGPKKSPSLTNLQGSLEDVTQYDSWLQGVEQKTEEDKTFVRSVSEAIKNLDETLAMEKTSSSSSQDSSYESAKKPLMTEFKLGPLEQEGKEESSSSDTEDETWRHRIERGEFTEKVKEKSKSVTDLMVLTHIESEGSETDSLPSLTRQYSIKKNGSKMTTFTSIGFGSEGNIHNAVLSEELQDRLRQLSLWKTDEQNFLGKAASEMKKTIYSSSTTGDQLQRQGVTKKEPVNNVEKDDTTVSKEEEKTSSSQETRPPEIVISVSKVSDIYTEPESDVVTDHLVNPPSRPFVFVCHEETPPESSVILGSCEEHTLAFFTGLKTTFKPPETSSDEEEDKQSEILMEKTIEDPNFTESEEDLINDDVPFSDEEVKEGASLGEVGSQESLGDQVPSDKDRKSEFKMNDIIAEEMFSQKRCNFDTYFSIDSGHSSDRCSDQEQQMNDLKTRLEDVAKLSEDFQLKRSEDEYGGKLHTPDDERSSDSGFRDKGSLSESVEDTCEEKYNLEDIDAELEEFNLKSCDKDDKYYDLVESEKQQTRDGWYLHPPTYKENSWLAVPAEDEEKPKLSLADEFVAAIRNELREKLPCALQVQAQDEDSSPEAEKSDNVMQSTYPALLSPILEEQESSQSSLIFEESNSPIFQIEAPAKEEGSFEADIIKALDYVPSPQKDVLIVHDLDAGNMEVFPSETCTADDVLVIDTETNEATLIESPKPKTQVAFIMPRTINENFTYEDDDDSIGATSETYNIPSPGVSCSSNTESSPENGVHSGFFLSPCSIRSDLFDSGPPSLPFDLGQSLEEVDDICQSKSDDEAKDEAVSPSSGMGFSLGLASNEQDEPFESLKSTDSASTLDAESCNGTESSSGKGSTVLFKCGEEVRPKTLNFNEKNPDSSLSSLTPSMSEQSGTFSERSGDCNIYESRTCFNCETEDLEPAAGDVGDVVEPEEEEKSAQLETESQEKIDRAMTVLDLIVTEPQEKKEEPQDEPSGEQTGDDTWLKNLFNCPSVSVSDASNWPSVEELIPEKDEDSPDKPKSGITSTLALQSPDLSFSTDSSKSHSLLSSFSSTPTCEESKPICEKIKEDLKLPLQEEAPAEGSLSTSAPLPSPEDADKGWRPTIGQLIELTDQGEGEEMTTSFIEHDGIYTPDWESDTSDEQSSSSGEFIWKEGDREDEIKAVAASSDLLSPQESHKTMDKIEEEDEKEEEDSSDSDEDSDESGAEFSPSTWDSTAVPTKSAIKVSPPTAPGDKKRVVFKKEKYQCIYQYPREPSDDEDDEPDSWTNNKPVYNYSMFEDWELADSEFPVSAEGDSDTEEGKSTKKHQDIDFYRLDYNIGQHFMLDDGEFFISSGGQGSEFFPGQGSFDDSDETIDFNPSACDLTPVKVPTTTSSLGELRHTKDQLRLELPAIRPDKGEASILDSGIDTSSA